MKTYIFNLLASQGGRVVKIILGMLFLAYGFEVNSFYILVGLIPLLAGVFDILVFAPLFGLPISGIDLRKKLKKK